MDTLLERVREAGLLKTRGRPRTDSTHVFAAVRMLNRLERIGETRRAALHALAVLVPEWLQQRVPLEWFERYGSRVENDERPKTEAARQQLALVIGEDGQRLLHAIDRVTDQPWLAHVPAMSTLRRVWSEPYIEEQGQLRWREVKEMPAAPDQLTSPDDTDARYSTQRHMEWIGDNVHFTATCDADTPHLMVNVETTPATTPDDPMAAVVHASLTPRHLLPSEHLVDTWYTDSRILVESQRHDGVTIVGPVADDPGGQAREGTGFDTSPCVGDWERQVVTCPAGKQSLSWLPHTYPASGLAIETRVARQDCMPCAFRVRCTRAKVEPRMVGLQVREPYEALQAARKRQTTEAFQHEYAVRSGIDSTHEHAIRRCG